VVWQWAEIFFLRGGNGPRWGCRLGPGPIYFGGLRPARLGQLGSPRVEPLSSLYLADCRDPLLLSAALSRAPSTKPAQ